ncbi:hypothetical protein ACO2J3_12160 [Leptospira interrogans]|uniref:hypothetical protein n=1 Tax=Leptospira interrogans TaxID=173 RepID=UPI0002925BDC|nr:hypothetical protein [Leptospira interrogans]EKO67674.1 hypothetical protein LEP1GSC069_1602 [Leptospira interrogans serovar Canicola str. Fiocruz LV133]EMK17333.1 hypothetical protein LEP1GSC075_2453 [Leptospira interrogans str. Kito]EMN76488.1 hypothetical protein LEP1GSC102_1277 [Leptospira interrogans str. UI 09600]MCH5432727.1 hypothetical protein [Leptospira interrogans serovar Canicola]
MEEVKKRKSELVKGMEAKKRQKGYRIGEAVKDKRSGQKMYVSALCSLEVLRP